MVAIRNKQIAKPHDVTYYNAWPLPSAGFVPLMQSFCGPADSRRNEFGFLEYPNSTTKEMIEKIEKILKTKWSASWFSNPTLISPLFQNGAPITNLNQLSAKLIQMLRGSDSDDDDDGNSPIRLSKRNAKNQNEEKKKRIDSMREFLCDKNETRLCNMTDTELNELDNNNSNNKDEYLGRLLQKGSSSSKMPLMDEAFFDDLNKKLTEFIEFQNALDDLSLLSIHFPTGLCNLDTFKQKQNLSKQEHHNQKPKSINSDPNSDPNLKKKLMKNYGFIGLWTNMQKTFCGAKDPLNKQQHQKSFNNNNNTSNNDTETTDTTDSPSSAFESSLNLTPGQLKSLSFLFQIVYSNPVILYTPNTTVVYEKLIKKSNGTF
jgi:hypothetical protein